ncbi:hypothetical protein QCE47_27305 [Caballeronia sp. LZ025]|uniref:hypothetical protein n=1 Tax=Caballeronia TaxID=1827195 RepID=UPI001FD1F115|nr:MULTISPECIES: hypothetical protein [Caballeronia]MDR5736025.1 hypothetical protein [Caballeronia sp. LZ025]MDR5883825.1 hypothetical protein [Caballeronia sp. LZ032]
MKFWVKLVACLLIVWLPLIGDPAWATSCPEMTAMASQQASVSDAFDSTPCGHDVEHNAVNVHHVCPGGASGFLCGVPPIPVKHSLLDAPSSPVYRAVTPNFAEEFIPELPAPPPRSV